MRWFVVTWAMVIPVMIFAGWGSASFPAAIALAGAGWFAWSLFEYFAHRKLFHWEPKWLWLQQMVFVIHGNHHAQPRDALRNLMPPVVSVPVGALVWSMFWLAFGDPGTWIAIGFVGGYVAYDLTHYACHHWPMSGPLGKRLKRHHMQHHFVAAHKNYGVSTIFWDRVFNTRVETKAKAHDPERPGEEALEPAE
ncbi:sterol desaturase family protein [Erythrobacter sp. KY5]|uniref:sterol desaturase family protein n=1 Tax=Erythrobacter sp. KY5 TaxID=2011159 RepID=UPI001F17BC17|nr:sterol desaturase family protein [Erythrobacter sp. KY5]